MLLCKFLKITKQREACKLWMRSRSANTARSDTRGDFVLDSPSAVSYLRSVFLLPFQLTIAGYQKSEP